MDFPLSAPAQARDSFDVAKLVAYLRSASRTRPVAVLTVARGQHAPYVSAEELATEFGRHIDVVTLPTDSATFALSDQLSDPAAGVFGGACRVYPPGDDWERHPRNISLLLATTPEHQAELPKRVRANIEFLLRKLARPQGTPGPPGAQTPAPKPPAATPKPTAPIAKPGMPTPKPGMPTPKPGMPTPKPGSTSPTPSAAPPKPTPPAPAAPKPGPPAPKPAPVVPRPPAPAQPRVAARAPHSEIGTPAEADDLAALLLSPVRDRPVLVVTRAAGTQKAFVDVAELRENLAGLVDVFEITTTAASWALSTAVPDKCQVYGGASRVYPLGTEWLHDPYLSPLRFAYGTYDRANVTRLLTSDALSMAARGGMIVQSTVVVKKRAVTGVVAGVVPGRALVQLPDQMGVVWPELVQPGVDAEWVFAKGMPIRGLLDPESRRIDVDEMRRTAADALAAYEPGQTILGRVTEVRPDGCTVELFPGVTQTIGAADLVRGNADVRLLVASGEVLRLWFAGRDEDEWVLSLLDAGDPDEVTPPPSLLEGGPPWLRLKQATPEEAAPGTEPADEADDAEFSSDDPVTTVQELRRESAQLAAVIRYKDQQIADLESKLSDSRSKLRDTERRAATRWSTERVFESEEEQLEFEIRVRWALTTTPSEKRDLPLAPWSYGPEFFDTLNKVQGIKREKVVEVLVHVLTGRDQELASRERHQLRSGSGGEDPPVVRPGGELCWRVSLQVKTPSARRLHYWQRNDGGIELSSIRLHDDFRP